MSDERLTDNSQINQTNQGMMMTVTTRYLVCVMAHNEEAVIRETVNSVLGQDIEPEARLDLYVFTNGCTDRTDELVQEIARRDERVHLISLSHKGKVYALRQSIAYFLRMHQQAPAFDRIFYVDADVTFLDTSTLRNLSRTLNSSPDLYLVSSYPLADAEQETNNWYLKMLSQVRQDVQANLRVNLVRGACYVIRYSALKRVGYPKSLLSDDMFLELRLNGHFVMDYGNPTTTKHKASLRGEIRRDLFTLIAREQIYSWYRQNKIDSLDPESARHEWMLHFGRPKDFMWYLLRRGKLLSLAVMATWLPIYKYNERKARLIFEESEKQQVNLMDYWVTQR